MFLKINEPSLKYSINVFQKDIRVKFPDFLLESLSDFMVFSDAKALGEVSSDLRERLFVEKGNFKCWVQNASRIFSIYIRKFLICSESNPLLFAIYFKKLRFLLGRFDARLPPSAISHIKVENSQKSFTGSHLRMLSDLSPNLQTLVIDGYTCHAENEFQVLSQLTALCSLTITNSILSGNGLNPLSALNSLKKLCLGNLGNFNKNYSHSGLETLSGLIWVQKLALYAFDQKLSLKFLEGFSSLQTLRLTSCSVNASELTEVKMPSELKELTFEDCDIGDKELHALSIHFFSNLFFIDFRKCYRISEKAIRNLTAITSLKVLYLDKGRVSSEFKNQLQSQFNIEIIDG